MRLVLATSNKGKVREIQALFAPYEVVPYTQLIEAFEIVEDAPTFKGNALIKARAVYAALGDANALVMADDSGISIAALDGAPDIYSARYAGVGATDAQNVAKVVENLHALGMSTSKAYYTAAIAVVGAQEELVTHGWMHGRVIDTPRGDKGFGYDPLFIPDGYTQTLGELDEGIKAQLSHRAQALAHMHQILKTRSY
ncbi:MAG: nucleoside-triphosphate diphosphatase [Sulfuricurvum sp. PC08-66]|nr:MAG: nucleoside-triphosphate diphosphatase [Sulfuricurvum sp. PC08-66]